MTYSPFTVGLSLTLTHGGKTTVHDAPRANESQVLAYGYFPRKAQPCLE